MQAVLRLIYPPACLSCQSPVAEEGMLCGSCRSEVPFIGGLVCDLCGTPLPGEAGAEAVHCDDCLTIARPWACGRAALLYQDRARSLVLAFKHGDRTDLAAPMAAWIERAVRPILQPGAIVVPVPLHWTRLVRRGYNQAALLGRELARRASLEFHPDALIRRRTRSLDGLTRDQRFAELAGAIRLRPGEQNQIRGRDLLVVDDVMTSGATLGAAASALIAAGAGSVGVVALARVAKEP